MFAVFTQELCSDHWVSIDLARFIVKFMTVWTHLWIPHESLQVIPVESFFISPVGVSSRPVVWNSLHYSTYIFTIYSLHFPPLPFQEKTHTPLSMMNVLLYYTLWNFQHILCSVKYKHVRPNGFTSSSYNVNTSSKVAHSMYPNSFLELRYFLYVEIVSREPIFCYDLLMSS